LQLAAESVIFRERILQLGATNNDMAFDQLKLLV
jgi:hypothetical protein